MFCPHCSPSRPRYIGNDARCPNCGWQVPLESARLEFAADRARKPAILTTGAVSHAWLAWGLSDARAGTGGVLAINPTAGEMFQKDGLCGPVAAGVAIHDEIVFGGDEQGNVFAVDLRQGNTLWVKTAADVGLRGSPRIESRPLIIDAERVLFAFGEGLTPEEGGALVPLMQRTGLAAGRIAALPETVPHGMRRVSSPLLLGRGEVCVAAYDGTVYRWSAARGLSPSFRLENDRLYQPPVATGGSLVIGTWGGRLLSLDARLERSPREVFSGLGHLRLPLLWDGASRTLVATTVPKSGWPRAVHAWRLSQDGTFDPVPGWRSSVPHTVFGLAVHDGLLFTADSDGTLRAVDLDSPEHAASWQADQLGSKLWSVNVLDDRVFAAGESGRIFAAPLTLGDIDFARDRHARKKDWRAWAGVLIRNSAKPRQAELVAAQVLAREGLHWESAEIYRSRSRLEDCAQQLEAAATQASSGAVAADIWLEAASVWRELQDSRKVDACTEHAIAAAEWPQLRVIPRGNVSLKVGHQAILSFDAANASSGHLARDLRLVLWLEGAPLAEATRPELGAGSTWGAELRAVPFRSGDMSLRLELEFSTEDRARRLRRFWEFRVSVAAADMPPAIFQVETIIANSQFASVKGDGVFLNRAGLSAPQDILAVKAPPPDPDSR